MDVEGENARFIVPAFEQRTGIHVDLQWLAWSAAHEKLLTAFAGGSLPDVLMLANAWLAEFAMIGALAPMPPDAASLMVDQFPEIAQATRIGPQSVALPWVVDTNVQYFRRDLVDLADSNAFTSWSGWKQVLHATRRRQSDGFPLLMQLDWPDHLMALAGQQPDPLLRDENSRGNFRSAGFRAALGFYKSLFDERLAPLASSSEVSDPVLELARGWIAIYPAGSWIRAELLRRQSVIPKDSWMTAPMPGPDGPGAALVSGSSLVVTRSARDPAKAWALVRYLCASATQVRFHRIAGNLPSRPTAWADPTLADDPVLQPFRAQLARAGEEPKVMEWSRITGEIQLIAERLVRGMLTIDEACVAMDTRVDTLLAKRRWLLDTGRVA